MPTRHLFALLCVFLATLTPLTVPAQQAASVSPAAAAFGQGVQSPCATDPRFHAFDFWIGEWDVQPTGSPRAPIGQGATSIIESQLGGCVVQENWIPNGKTAMGKSFNIYNTVTRQWEQYYVDARGTITHYKGAFKDDGNLYFEADQPATGAKVRMTFFNQGPNQVRQLGHISKDGGTTWTVTFDLTYLRKQKKSEVRGQKSEVSFKTYL